MSLKYYKTKRKKIDKEILPGVKEHSEDSDAAPLIVTFLFLPLRKVCDHVPSDYIVCILYVTWKT